MIKDNIDAGNSFEQALEACASEPIHQIGTIQPHGAAVVFATQAPHTVLHVSSNIGSVTGISPQDWIARPFSDVVPDAAEDLMSLVARLESHDTVFGRLALRGEAGGETWLAHVYPAGPVRVLELEPVAELDRDNRAENIILGLHSAALEADEATGLQAYLDAIAELVRGITGYDSVMVYRFDDDWHGEVISQSQKRGTPSYLGMHFPSADIPEQARRLFTVNRVRVVADIDAERVPLIPPVEQGIGKPLDMSYSALRSLSPIHMEYLRNMGVHGSMAISLLQDGRLWGLIACHHMTPKQVSIGIREIAVYISRLVSARLGSVEALQRRGLAERALKLHSGLIRAVTSERTDDLVERWLPDLQALLDATGIILVIDGRPYYHGEVPGEGRLDDLIRWVVEGSREGTLAIDNLGDAYPPVADHGGAVAGLLAPGATSRSDDRIIWLRREKPLTVNWAGKYEEGFVRNAAGEYRLTPRKSFDIWRENWTGRCTPWTVVEKELAELISHDIPEGLAQKRRRDEMREELARHRDHLEEMVASRTAELEEARVAAEAANVAKSYFLANMSHEIRTPLNVILGMSQIIRRAGASPEQAQKLERIDDAGRHLLEVINSVLDLSKIEADQLQLNNERLDLDTLVADTCSMLALGAKEKGLAARSEVEAIDEVLLGDATRLQQALLNYGSNAVKFTAGGSITLRVRREKEQSKHLLVRFEVEDTGPGIPTEDLDRVFLSFEQVDNSHARRFGGTGLGLAITRKLARRMGGEAGVSSTLGEGSTFWFTARLAKALPSEEKEQGGGGVRADVKAKTDDSAIEKRHAGSRVLLAEDDELNAEVAIYLLQELGLRVDWVTDGQAAIERAGEHGYDLILMDMQMPVMDGLTATARIRELPIHASTPILALTANAFIEDRQRCFEAGMSDFVAKPLDANLLVETLLKWLDDWRE